MTVSFWTVLDFKNVATESVWLTSWLINFPAPQEEGGGGGVGILADDDGGGGGDNGNSTGDGVMGAMESTTWLMCKPPAKCCYQYTWPGYRSTIPDPSNATCDYIRKEKRDTSFPCFDPLVFTEPRLDENGKMIQQN